MYKGLIKFIRNSNKSFDSSRLSEIISSESFENIFFGLEQLSITRFLGYVQYILCLFGMFYCLHCLICHKYTLLVWLIIVNLKEVQHAPRCETPMNIQKE